MTTRTCTAIPAPPWWAFWRSRAHAFEWLALPFPLDVITPGRHRYRRCTQCGALEAVIS